MDILIVKPSWADKILSGEKEWEIRGCSTKKHGKIGIAKSGTSCIFGEVNIVDSILLTKNLWEENVDKHLVRCTWDCLLEKYKHPYAWIFEPNSAKRYDSPVPYVHPKGAVIWVKNR